MQQGHKALQENEVKFCTLREEFRGGPVESAPAWRDWALVASPNVPGELPWLHPPLLSKGWWLRPALTASRLSFWVPPECIGIKFYPGSVDGTFEEDSPPILECRDLSVLESAHLGAVTNGTCIWLCQPQSPDQFGSLTYTSSQLQGWSLLKNIGVGWGAGAARRNKSKLILG